MKRKVCGDTVAVRLYPGEELTAALKEVCEQERIVFGTVSGIARVTGRSRASTMWKTNVMRTCVWKSGWRWSA